MSSRDLGTEATDNLRRLRDWLMSELDNTTALVAEVGQARNRLTDKLREVNNELERRAKD